MRKYFVLIQILLSASLIFTQDVNLINRFRVASASSCINYDETERAKNPRIIKIFDDAIIIHESIGNRLTVLDRNGNFMYNVLLPSISINNENNSYDFFNEDYIFINFQRPLLVSGYYIIDINNEKIFTIDTNQVYDRFIVEDKLYLITDDSTYGDIYASYKLSVINLSQLNEMTILKPEILKKKMTSNLDLGESYNFLTSDKSITPWNWNSFVDKTISKNERISISTNIRNKIIWNFGDNDKVIANNILNSHNLKRYNPYFIGNDNDGNFYWEGLIISKSGELLDTIQYRNNSLNVAPNGDLYFLSFSGKFIELYHIKSTWNHTTNRSTGKNISPVFNPSIVYKTSYATFLEDGLRIRTRPGMSQILGQLKKADQVTVMSKTDFLATIDGFTAPWIAIKTTNDVYGWVFGAFLNVNFSDKLVKGWGDFTYSPPAER